MRARGMRVLEISFAMQEKYGAQYPSGLYGCEKAEQEHGDGYADKVAEYAECRAKIKIMLDSM